MNDNPTENRNYLQCLSRIAKLCSEYPLSLTTEEIISLIAGQLPGYAAGLLISVPPNKAPIIVTAGNAACTGLASTILNEYARSPALFRSVNYQLEIGSADFTLRGERDLKLLLHGLRISANIHGLLALIGPGDHRLSDQEAHFIEVCTRLIAASALSQYSPGAANALELPAIASSPRQTVNDLLKEISRVEKPQAAILGYLIPGDDSAEIFLATADKAAIHAEFSPDVSIKAQQFKPEIVHNHWNSPLQTASLPEALALELEKCQAAEIIFFPLKGRTDYYGFCLLAFDRKPEGAKESAISKIIAGFHPRFAASAALQLLISTYRRLLISDKSELVKLTAATVNHYVNNYLAIILGAAQLILLKEHELPADIRRKIEVIEINTLRIRDVISSIRNLKNINIAEYLAGEKFLDIL